MTRDVYTPDYRFRTAQALLGAQILFEAFGALVLMPLLTGMESSIALCTAGVGALLCTPNSESRTPCSQRWTERWRTASAT